MKNMLHFIFSLLVTVAAINNAWALPADTTHHAKQIVYQINILSEIDPASWHMVQNGFKEAQEMNANMVLIRMNTYGGMLNSADSIRTKILNSPIPVWIFIDNQAASAGALISIAAEKIYMRKGASIGAATVVDQTGQALPDKYQSFMRSMMRATAESHGKDTIVTGKDTTYRWKRDPLIAEAMVDPRTVIPGIIDSTKVLTFTTLEAIKNHYCEGEAESVRQVLAMGGVTNYVIHEQRITGLDSIMGWLLNPVVQGILIMLIFAGIYFELQTPGIGFPIILAIIAAAVYFAPLYLEGLAENWEIIMFLIGLVLIAIEIFAIPGFGIVGITGIVLAFLGLTLSMIDNNLFKEQGSVPAYLIVQPVVIVSVSMFLSLVMVLFMSKNLFTNKRSPLYRLALHARLTEQEGFVGVDLSQKNMVGKTGIAVSVLRPSGKVEIEGNVYDAISTEGFTLKGETVVVKKDLAGQLYVTKS